MPNSTKNRRSRRGKRASPENVMSRLLEQTNVKYSPGREILWTEHQKPRVLEIPGALQIYTMSAGALASNLALDPTARIDNWASRWAAVFKQYVILGIEVYVTINTVGNAQGQVWFRVEEDFAVPTSVMSRQEHATLVLSAPSDTRSRSVMALWKPASSEDFTWTNVSSGFTPCYVKLFASNATSGCNSGDSTTAIAVQPVFRLGLRYLA